MRAARILRNILCIIFLAVVLYAVSIVLDGFDGIEMRRISGTYCRADSDSGNRMYYVLWQDGTGKICAAGDDSDDRSRMIKWSYDEEDSIISVRFGKRKMDARFTDNDTIEFNNSVVWVKTHGNINN